MPDILLVPTNANGSLRYYDAEEIEAFQIETIGVSGEGDHLEDELSPNGAGGTRRFFCDWDYRYHVARMFVGAVGSYEVDGVRLLSRLLPEPHPNFVNYNWVATGVRLLPYRFEGTQSNPGGRVQALPDFERAKVVVTYEQVPFVLLDDDELDAGGETGEITRYVTLPGYPGADISAKTDYVSFGTNTLKFVTADGVTRPATVPVPFAIGVTETKTSKKVIWRRVPVDVWGPGTALTTMVKGDGTPSNRGYIGALNLTSIWGHPPLTLKFDGVEERLLPDPSGIGYAWDLGYLFEEKATPFGHTGLLWSEVLKDGGGGVAPAYYQALSRFSPTDTNKTAAELAAVPGSTQYPIKELRNLFKPGGA